MQTTGVFRFGKKLDHLNTNINKKPKIFRDFKVAIKQNKKSSIIVV